MKKVILSMVCVFAFSTIVSAKILKEENCIEKAMELADAAEDSGYSYEDAYVFAMNEYSRCKGGSVK